VVNARLFFDTQEAISFGAWFGTLEAYALENFQFEGLLLEQLCANFLKLSWLAELVVGFRVSSFGLTSYFEFGRSRCSPVSLTSSGIGRLIIQGFAK